MTAYAPKMQPTKDATITDKEEQSEYWKIEVQEWMKEKKEMEENLLKIYGMVNGQCTDAMKAVLQEDPKYEDESEKRNAVWLMNAIKSIKSGIHPSRNMMRMYFMKMKELFGIRQERNKTLDSLRKQIRAGIDNVTLVGGTGLVQPVLKNRPTSLLYDDALAEEFATMFFSLSG